MEHRQHAPTLFRWTLNKRLLHMNIVLSYAVYCCINLPGTNCQNDPPGSREPRERAFGAGLRVLLSLTMEAAETALGIPSKD